MSTEPAGEDGYRGPAAIKVGSTELPVDVTLRGHFEPLDGRYHWYGRIAVDQDLTNLVTSGKADAVLTTEEGSAAGQLSDVDPWGRFRISGISTPPFRVLTSLDQL